MINKERLIRLTQELVRIPSENPGGNEEAVARYVARLLRRLGLRPRTYEFKQKRTNVVATLKGRDSAGTLLITPHLDTVPAGKSWRYPPFGGLRKGKRLYGLGATDCKCNLAVGLEAMESLVEEGCVLDYNLCLAATADEESGSALGLIPLLDKGILRPDAALVLDADDFAVVVAQKGLIHLKVQFQGTKAHGAYPWRGDNAILHACESAAEIRRFPFRRRRHRLLLPPTVNIGTIHGGDKVNVVADWCEMELDFRFLPGDSAGKILADLKRLLARHTRRYSIEVEGIQQPYQISETHPLVRHLNKAMEEKGVRPRIQGSEGATTITFFQEKGIPAVATGFGDEGCAHIADEYVNVENVYKGALVLEEFLRRWKG